MLSSDQQMFRSVPQTAYLIEKGKISKMVRDCGLEASTEFFWSRLDTVGGEKHLKAGGDMNPQNDNPAWECPFSVAVPPVKFTGIQVFETKTGAGK
jgi:predicted Zn-dependent protease